MNYCSIEDAWGQSNCPSQQFKEHMTNSHKNTHITEKMTNIDNNQLLICEDVIHHIKHCRKCYNKIKEQFKPKLVENLHDIINDHKDNIVLILFAISIILFFNLINNLSK